MAISVAASDRISYSHDQECHPHWCTIVPPSQTQSDGCLFQMARTNVLHLLAVRVEMFIYNFTQKLYISVTHQTEM